MILVLSLLYKINLEKKSYLGGNRIHAPFELNHSSLQVKALCFNLVAYATDRRYESPQGMDLSSLKRPV